MERKTPSNVRISTWVGYDLDGRSDINWRTSFILRLKEKISLEFYLKQLSAFKIKSLSTVLNLLKKELIATKSEITNFEDIDKDIKVFSKNINKFKGK